MGDLVGVRRLLIPVRTHVFSRPRDCLRLAAFSLSGHLFLLAADPYHNAFSKKLENLAAAVSLHFFHYNFCRVHKTLGTSPAVAAGVTDHVWTLDELIGLLEAAEATPTKRGRYAKTRQRRAAGSR
jgi:hypothetical protein